MSRVRNVKSDIKWLSYKTIGDVTTPKKIKIVLNFIVLILHKNKVGNSLYS